MAPGALEGAGSGVSWMSLFLSRCSLLNFCEFSFCFWGGGQESGNNYGGEKDMSLSVCC